MVAVWREMSGVDVGTGATADGTWSVWASADSGRVAWNARAAIAMIPRAVITLLELWWCLGVLPYAAVELNRRKE
jgi:hypothetical protein